MCFYTNCEKTELAIIWSLTLPVWFCGCTHIKPPVVPVIEQLSIKQQIFPFPQLLLSAHSSVHIPSEVVEFDSGHLDPENQHKVDCIFLNIRTKRPQETVLTKIRPDASKFRMWSWSTLSVTHSATLKLVKKAVKWSSITNIVATLNFLSHASSQITNLSKSSWRICWSQDRLLFLLNWKKMHVHYNVRKCTHSRIRSLLDTL